MDPIGFVLFCFRGTGKTAAYFEFCLLSHLGVHICILYLSIPTNLILVCNCIFVCCCRLRQQDSVTRTAVLVGNFQQLRAVTEMQFYSISSCISQCPASGGTCTFFMAMSQWESGGDMYWWDIWQRHLAQLLGLSAISRVMHYGWNSVWQDWIFTGHHRCVILDSTTPPYPPKKN